MTDKPYDPSKDMLEKMHADDDAQSEKDAERFTEEQKAMGLKTAQDYLAKTFEERHPSPHAARDKTEEYDMRPKGNSRLEGSPGRSDGEVVFKNPLYDLDMVEQEGADFEYECRDGKNLDEKAEQLAQSEMTADIGGLKRIIHTPDGEGCVRGGPNPWDDPLVPPMPPALPMPSPEDMEKLKETIEKMGQGQDGTGGYRMNAGKNRVELLPEIWLWALADVMTKGALKYEDRNWEKGMDWSAMIGCIYRHMAKFQSGQRYDGKEFNKELGATGCHELAMVAWNALALMFYDIYGLGNNDLPVYDSLDHFTRVNGSGSDLAVRWAKEDSNDASKE